MRRINRAITLLLVLLLGGVSAAWGGSAFISGDDSDDDASTHCRAPLCGNMMGKVLRLLYETDCGFGLNGDGILAIGTNNRRTRTALEDWNNPINGGPGATITACNTLACIDSIGYQDSTATELASFRLLYVASVDVQTTGGVTGAQLAALNDGPQPNAIYRWFNNIGGTDDGRIMALTEAEEVGAYGWLPVALEYEEPGSPFDIDDVNIVEPAFTSIFPGHGATDTNLDHCCYHNVFTGPAGFNGMIVVADTPDHQIDDPDNPGTLIDGPMFLGNICFDLNAGPVCDPGGPYEAVCDATGTTSIPVDASNSRDPEGGPITYAWTTDCPGGSFDDPTLAVPILTLSSPPPCPVVCTVTVTITDDHAQSSACTATVTADDTTPPFLDVALPIVKECAGPIGFPDADTEIAAWLAEAAASDDCTSATLVDDHPTLFPSGCNVETAVVWTATDECGNETERTSTVTVVDTTAPTLAVPAPLVLECDAPGPLPASSPRLTPWLAAATADDICGGVGLSDDHPAEFASGCSVATPVEWTATDDCGIETKLVSTLTIVDTTPPTLAVPPPLVLECSGPTPVPASDPRLASWLAGATAADTCTGVSLGDNHPAEFPVGCAVTTVVEWAAVDGCSQVTTLTSSVTFVDTAPPTITVPAPLLLECDHAGGVPANDPRVVAWLASATASDVCGAVAAFTHDAPGFLPSGCVPGHETIVHWTAIDACGHATTASAAITVVDLTPPVVTAMLAPADPAKPTSASSAASTCSSPAQATFIVDCTITDTCDPSPILSAELVVTTQSVPTAGTCETRFDIVPVSCGERIEIILLPPLCPKKPHSAGDPVSVNSDGTRIVSGQAIELRVTGVDHCGNEAETTFDPTREPPPPCESPLGNGTCCPPLTPPMGPKCGLPLCEVKNPLAQPKDRARGPVPTAVSGPRLRQGVRGGRAVDP